MPEWIQIVLRTMAAIVILFIMTKVLGKRQISELSLFEYITGISIGNIAAYVSLDLDNLWFLGIVSLIVWVSVSVGIELLTLKSKKIRDVVDGKGTVLIRDGRLFRDKMKKERITLDELLNQLRKKDVYRVADVEFAIMEASGEVNVLLKKELQPITPDMLGWRMSEERAPYSLVMDGQVIEEELKDSGHNKEWLNHELGRHNLKLEDIFLSQLDTQGQLTFMTVDGHSYPKQSSSKAQDKIQGLTKQLEQELKRLEKFAINESDRKKYQSAIFHINQGVEAIRLKPTE
ncbi:DUF421 domain-containing protein [Paenibacillus sp. GSMTC-2017]|uniref:DUF421 domain-containing protein n=1 Tax=Paenibacillus sp. GSMTC-2017 TaxID=2794350 RepID=UPI0018D63DC8|nr:DUF421 domain-containing protein [Paenibacillus sp. GSMTC-2017]MBH5320182.1 DUF421 domain-containing protein [Paenibacillus sp. GSMTC-2017]